MPKDNYRYISLSALPYFELILVIHPQNPMSDLYKDTRVAPTVDGSNIMFNDTDVHARARFWKYRDAFSSRFMHIHVWIPISVFQSVQNTHV